MANKHASLDALFADIANAIREKTGETGTIPAAEFPSMIRDNLEVIPQVTLISFTIDGISCQAEEGMTVGEWLGSSYNEVPFMEIYYSGSKCSDDTVLSNGGSYSSTRQQSGNSGGN